MFQWQEMGGTACPLCKGIVSFSDCGEGRVSSTTVYWKQVTTKLNSSEVTLLPYKADMKLGNSSSEV